MCAISTVWKNKLSSACNHLWIFLSTQDFQLTFQHFSICQWPKWVVASAPDNDDVVVHDEGGVIASIPTAGACVVKVVGTKIQWNVPNLMLAKWVQAGCPLCHEMQDRSPRFPPQITSSLFSTERECRSLPLKEKRVQKL